jgi:hypothetical protein
LICLRAQGPRSTAPNKMRNLLIARTEQAPFCAMFLGSAKGRGARHQGNEELLHRRAEQAPFCARFLKKGPLTCLL